MTSSDYYLLLNMEYLILFITGIIGGLIAGTLGLGGGIFYIIILPTVMIWYGIPASESATFVVANSLFGIAMASGTSAFSSFKKIKKYLKESMVLGIPAIIISLLSTHYIVHSNWFSQKMFNGFVIFLMLFILIQMILKTKNSLNQKEEFAQIPLWPGIFSGGTAGFVSALSGLGGGIIIIPILQIKFKQDIQKAKFISLIIIFLSSFLLSVQNLLTEAKFKTEELSQIGYILPSVVIPIVLGVFIGGPLGIKWSNKMPDKSLNILFIVFILIILIEKSVYFI